MRGVLCVLRVSERENNAGAWELGTMYTINSVFVPEVSEHELIMVIWKSSSHPRHQAAISCEWKLRCRRSDASSISEAILGIVCVN